MARRTTLTSLEAISEINLTPLMDLTFILLIAFIITYPLIEQGIPVTLPRGDAQELDPDMTRTVSIDDRGALYLDERAIEDDALREELRLLGRADPELTVYVRADEAIRYGRLMDVVRWLHEAKITRMALVTQPESAEGP
jgi:biopolymer transport protein TolR